MCFNFQKLLDTIQRHLKPSIFFYYNFFGQNIVLTFPEVVRDNVVSDSHDYVIILRKNFLFSQQNESLGWFIHKLRNYVYIC